MKKIYIFFLFCISFIGARNAWGQDECTTAVMLTVTQPNQSCSSILYDNTAATTSGTDPIPPCWSPATVSHTMWFSFKPDSNQVHISTNFAQSLSNTHIAVYSGVCGSLTQIACQEDASASGGLLNNDITVTGLTPGVTY